MIGLDRRLALVRGDLAAARAIARAHGGTVNDVVLAAAVGGLRDLLLARGGPVRGLVLRASVPVFLHGEQPGVPYGNRIGWMAVPLPAGEPCHAHRLELIAGESAACKEHARLQATSGIFRFSLAQSSAASSAVSGHARHERSGTAAALLPCRARCLRCSLCWRSRATWPWAPRSCPASGSSTSPRSLTGAAAPDAGVFAEGVRGALGKPAGNWHGAGDLRPYRPAAPRRELATTLLSGCSAAASAEGGWVSWRYGAGVRRAGAGDGGRCRAGVVPQGGPGRLSRHRPGGAVGGSLAARRSSARVACRAFGRSEPQGPAWWCPITSPASTRSCGCGCWRCRCESWPCASCSGPWRLGTRCWPTRRGGSPRVAPSGSLRMAPSSSRSPARSCRPSSMEPAGSGRRPKGDPRRPGPGRGREPAAGRRHRSWRRGRIAGSGSGCDLLGAPDLVTAVEESGAGNRGRRRLGALGKQCGW